MNINIICYVELCFHWPFKVHYSLTFKYFFLHLFGGKNRRRAKCMCPNKMIFYWTELSVRNCAIPALSQGQTGNLETQFDKWERKKTKISVLHINSMKWWRWDRKEKKNCTISHIHTKQAWSDAQMQSFHTQINTYCIWASKLFVCAWRPEAYY